AARLRHPNIVPIHDVGIEDGRHFLTMDFIEGEDLHAALPKLSPRRFLEVVREIARALQAAHEAGLVHRDVKPGNILLDASGRAYIADFGLAKDLRRVGKSQLTQTGAILGTPEYMSPEQAQGRLSAIGPGSDQWSLGVILYHSLAGRFPFPGETLDQILLAIATAEPERPSRVAARSDRRRPVHRDLETICLKCLEKDPARRFATAGELADDLDRFLDGEPIRARAIGRIERLARRARKHRWAVGLVLAALVPGIAFGGWALSQALAAEQARRADRMQGDRRARDEKERRARSEARAIAAEKGLEAGTARLQQDQNTQARAAALLESGRLELEKALVYLARSDATREELDRVVASGQEKIEGAIAADPGLAQAHYLLGRAWDLRDRQDRAEESWKRALELAPDLAAARYLLGKSQVYRALGLTLVPREERDTVPWREARVLAEEGLAEIDAALFRETAAFDPVAREVGLATCTYVKSDHDGARRIVTAALARFAGHGGEEELWLLLGLLESGEESIRALDRAIELRPNFTLAFACRGAARQVAGDADGAIEDCAAALRISPRDAGAFHHRGIARAAKGDHRAAIADFDASLNLAGWATTRYHRGLARQALGDLASAITDFDEVVRRGACSVAVYSQRALARKESGDWDGAIAGFDEVLKLTPRSAEAYRQRGLTRQAKGDLDGAIADYGAALKIDGNHAAAWKDRAGARYAKGDAPGGKADRVQATRLDRKAVAAILDRVLGRPLDAENFAATLAACAEALQVDPACARAYLGRASVRRQSGDPEGAIADCDRAILAERENPEGFHQRGLARWNQGDVDGANADLVKAAELRPKYAKVLEARGSARLDDGDFEGAVLDCSEALKIDPQNLLAYLYRGVARDRMGDLDGAIADFSAVLGLWPRHTLAWKNRALVRKKKGDLDGSVADYTQAVALGARDADALEGRGLVFQQRRDYDAAIADFDAALRLDPKRVSTLVQRGWTRNAKGDRKGALVDYDFVLNLDASHAVAWLLRGETRLTLGDRPGAQADFEQALKVAPEDWSLRKRAQDGLQATRGK
ncbi:MAG: tetratricopeptide repeat protein, partial [Planctomycetes bacterium]|nr:tetratricopeptide repeat protein [Planctomycetota bacterium]